MESHYDEFGKGVEGGDREFDDSDSDERIEGMKSTVSNRPGVLGNVATMQSRVFVPNQVDFVLEAFPKAGSPEFDERAEAELKRLYLEIQNLKRDMSVAIFKTTENEKSLSAHNSYLTRDVQDTFSQHNERLISLEQAVERLKESQRKSFRKMQQIATEAGLSSTLAKDTLANAEHELLAAIADLNDAKSGAKFARKEDEETAAATVEEAETAVDERTMAYLRIKSQQKFDSKAEPKLPMVQITNLQAQLAENIRQGLADKPAADWSWRTMFSTDKNTRALNSVRTLSKNAAFSMSKDRKKAELEVNIEILELMMLASYALSDFGKIFAVVTSKASDDADADNDSDDGNSVDMSRSATKSQGTPLRKMSIVDGEALSDFTAKKVVSASKSATKEVAEIQTSDVSKDVLEKNAISQAVVDVIRKRLANIQTKAGGLLGTQNPSMQFWGKVLMTLAIAIAVTLAAAALMATLGVATPAYLVPYFAAVKASALVSTVLNFVAAKLTLDLNAAAAVSAAATAGAFGVFGKGLHMAGGPNNFKRSLDKAAQDMEAALADTETAKYKPGM